METGKIEFNPMDKNTGQEILKRLSKLITLLEEQNDIMLFENESNCCSECDGTCEKE